MKKVAAGLVLCLLLSFITAQQAFADWAFGIVVNDGNMYKIMDVTVEEGRIGKQIGEVTLYSDQEGTYRGNFSNTFPKGTPYYAITGEDTIDVVAVKTPDGSYVTAVYDGKYAEAGIWTSVYFWIGVVIAVLSFMFAVVWLSNPKKKAAR